MSTDNLPAASALIEALAALRAAERAVNQALDLIGTTSPAPVTRVSAAVRTTGTQIIAVLAAAGEPLTLIDIADGVLALRRGEDQPRKRGGTVYQEMCRSSLARLIDRGLVERVPPAGRHDLMRFRRTGVAERRVA
jgi:hypothetical protein